MKRLVLLDYYSLIILLLLINLIGYLIVLPYIQKETNSHLASGHFFCAICLFLSILPIIFVVHNTSLQTIKYILLFVAISISFLILGYKLWYLYCTVCESSG